MKGFKLSTGRPYIYASLALIVVTYNFFFELKFSSLQEAILETIVLLPMVFGFLLLIYGVRKKLFRIPAVKHFIQKSQLNKNLFTVSAIAMKGFLVTVISRIISMLAFEGNLEGPFFDLLFLTILLSVVVVIIFIYFLEEYLGFIQEKHKMAIELSNAENEKMLAKYNSLKKQLNPHFLFNSFNSLISLIPVDTQKAEKFVEELSNIYRYNLSQSDELVVKLSDELNMIRSYIHLQKIRFGEALHYKEQLKIATDEVLIPPMTLQLLIENAIKHNKVSKQNPLEIVVYNKNNNIVVRNNLQKIQDVVQPGNNSFGIGMSSLKSQLNIITNEPLRIEQDETFFSVYIPLINTELND